MPRNGADIYELPPGTYGEPDETIYSGKYNTFLDDVAFDLNAPRPIQSGGTGALTAAEAIVNLGGEIAGQVVVNYDEHVWISGSFSSSAGATAAPLADKDFVGMCVIHENEDFVFLAARVTNSTDNPGDEYFRHKRDGVWGDWTLSDKLDVTGGTMTGPLTATDLTATGNLSVGGIANVTGALTVSGNNTVNGNQSVIGSLSVTNDITVYRSYAPSSGYIFYSNAGGRYFGFNGSAFDLVGGGLTINGNALTVGAAASVAHGLTVGHAITGYSSLNVAGHCTLGNATVNGGVLYMNAGNNYYIQQSGGVLNYNGQTIYHTGNLSVPASVTNIRFVYVGDWLVNTYNMTEPYGSSACVTGMHIHVDTQSYAFRFRQCQYYIGGGWANAHGA